MAQLNCKHLQYFWAVASHGSIARAAQVLHLTPQTISGQLRLLEEAVGAKLFEKSGRRLVLSDTGRVVLSYADEMFRLSNELRDVLQGRLPGAPRTFNVGIANVVPKLIAYRVLTPALRLAQPVRLVCDEAPLDALLADLAVHRLDLVLTDSPLSPTLNIRAYSHLLGECPVGFFATPAQAQRYRQGFPKSLDGAPMLMPTAHCALRRSLEQWFARHGIKPLMVAEFEDRALMKAFGEGGVGVFTSPTVIEKDVIDKYGVELIARSEEITERFYAISTERRIKHPAVSAITDTAREQLFARLFAAGAAPDHVADQTPAT